MSMAFPPSLCHLKCKIISHQDNTDTQNQKTRKVWSMSTIFFYPLGITGFLFTMIFSFSFNSVNHKHVYGFQICLSCFASIFRTVPGLMFHRVGFWAAPHCWKVFWYFLNRFEKTCFQSKCRSRSQKTCNFFPYSNGFSQPPIMRLFMTKS